MRLKYPTTYGEVKVSKLNTALLKRRYYKTSCLGIIKKRALERAFKVANRSASPFRNIRLRYFSSKSDFTRRTARTIPSKKDVLGHDVFTKRLNSADCITEHHRDTNHIISACSSTPSLRKQIVRVRDCMDGTEFDHDTHLIKSRRQCRSKMCSVCNHNKSRKLCRTIDLGLKHSIQSIKHLWVFLVPFTEVDMNADAISEGIKTLYSALSKVLHKSEFVHKAGTSNLKSNMIGSIFSIEVIPSRKNRGKAYIHAHVITAHNSKAARGGGWIKNEDWNSEIRKYIPDFRGISIGQRSKGNIFDIEAVMNPIIYTLKPMGLRVADYTLTETEKSQLGIPADLHPSQSTVRKIKKSFFKALIPALAGQRTYCLTGLFKEARKVGKIELDRLRKEKQDSVSAHSSSLAQELPPSKRDIPKEHNKPAYLKWEQKVFTDKFGCTWQCGEFVLQENTALWLLHETINTPRPISSRRVIDLEDSPDNPYYALDEVRRKALKSKTHDHITALEQPRDVQLSLFPDIAYSNSQTPNDSHKADLLNKNIANPCYTNKEIVTGVNWV